MSPAAKVTINQWLITAVMSVISLVSGYQLLAYKVDEQKKEIKKVDVKYATEVGAVRSAGVVREKEIKKEMKEYREKRVVKMELARVERDKNMMNIMGMQHGIEDLGKDVRRYTTENNKAHIAIGKSLEKQEQSLMKIEKKLP